MIKTTFMLFHNINDMKHKYEDGYTTKNGLTVLEHLWVKSHRSYYRCLSSCCCKKEIVVKGDWIEQQKYCSRSCPDNKKNISLCKFVDLSGQKSGKLTIVDLSDKKYKDGQNYWNCICECGRKTIVRHGQLTKKKTVSCGCNRLDYHSASDRILSRRFSDIIKTAKDRNIPLEITKEDYRGIAFSPCAYCGEIDEKKITPSKNRNVCVHYDITEVVKINGVDRIDSDGNYSKDNIQPCCKKCNFMKLDLTEDSFLEHIKKIASYRKL